MFGFLKDKLKGALSDFTKKVKEVVTEQTPEEEKVKVKKPKKAAKKKAKPIKKEKPAPKEKAKKKVVKKEVVEEKPAEVIEEKKEEVIEEKEEKGFFAKIKEKFTPEPVIEEKVDKELEETEAELENDEVTEQEAAFEEGEADAELLDGDEQEEEEDIEKEVKSKGFFAKVKEAVTKTSLSEDKFEDLFWNLEVILLENNVAVEVIDKIKEDMKETLVKGKISRLDVESTVLNTLKKSIDEILTFDTIDLLKESKKKKPLVISFVGVNGAGKTTVIAKLTQYFLDNKKTVVLAAADTFRAAAIQQLEEHANKLGVKIIKQDYGADAAAVAFDAVKYADSKGIDVVLIDTAGRLHSNVNLMDEMKKIIRVAKPDLNIFVGEAITGNDCVDQAQEFSKAIDIDGIILSKADVDEKGGASISVSYVTKKPILFLGTGQKYSDLKKFKKGRDHYNIRIMKNERVEAWMRIVIGIISGIVFSVWKILIYVFVVINFLITVFTGKRSKELAEFSEFWNTGVYIFLRYMTFVSNVRPFPFTKLKKMSKFER